jgi:hypothetical protein
MFHETESSTAPASNGFQLKGVTVELLPRGGAAPRVTMALAELEQMRTGLRPLPASRHGLETICGASCEVGAQ